MGVKGKLTASIEVNCGGHLIHDHFHTKPHLIPNITPSKIQSFEFLKGETIKVGSVVSWKYNDDGKDKIIKHVIEAIDPESKSITWKVIGGDVLELYDSFTVITSCDLHWATWTFLYEKKTEEIPEPLVLLGFLIGLAKDIESHLLK